MAITTHIRLCILLLLFVAALACGDGPTEPTPIGRPTGLVLTGAWQGFIGPTAQSSSSLNATWNVSQTDTAVSGPIALANRTANIAFSGTLTGRLSGTQLPVTYTIPRGNVPNFPDCSMAGTGTLEASATVMSGTLNVTYTNCVGFINEASTTDPVSLVKQ